MSEQPAPVFVGGADARATAEVAALIGTSSRYRLLPRLRFHVDRGGLAEALDGEVPLARVIHRLRNVWFASGTGAGTLVQGVDRNELEDAIGHLRKHFDEDGAGAAREFMDRVATQLTGERSPSWVEMTPRNIDHACALHDLYPGAAFIHVVRDGRDVAAAAAANTDADVLTAIARWKDRILDAFTSLRHLPEGVPIETVHIEDLVGPDRRRAFSRIAEALQLPWERDTRVHLEHRMTPEDAGVGRWQNEVPPHRHRALHDAWREQLKILSAKDVPWFEHVSLGP